MNPLDLMRLRPLMRHTRGKPEIRIGLIDGPVAMEHPDLANERFIELADGTGTKCAEADSVACRHGTFVAGILAARRGSGAPAVCPDCTLLIRPIFTEEPMREAVPSATHEELAAAVLDCISAGARVINLSLALARPSINGARVLEEAFDQAVRRGVIVVAAAGNQGAIGGSAIIRHPWVIPVAACDSRGRPLTDSNLGGSIGRRGLRALGADITSLGGNGKSVTGSGTSVAAPFVTGVIALLWSEFSTASAEQIKRAVTQPPSRRRTSVVPPLLDAAAAYHVLRMDRTGKHAA